MDLEFDVVELPACSPPSVGDPAPDFERPLVTDEAWRNVRLSELLEDGPVVLVFHPMIGSFPATYIWQAIETRSWHSRFDVTPVGVAVSTPYDIRRFIDERNIAGRLFSDPANQVARQYDVEHDLDGMAGLVEPRPAVFLLDTEGTVRYSWVASEWPSFPEYEAIEAAMESL